MTIDRVKVLEKAQKFAERRAYDKALVEYRRLLAADPKDARTLLKTAELEAKTGAFGDACATYETLAKLYTRQGFVPKAIAVYRQMRDVISKNSQGLDQQYGHIVAEVGELYYRLGHVNEARASFDEAAKRLIEQRRDQEAIVILRRILEIEPSATMSRIRLAEALFRVRDLDGALSQLDAAARALVFDGRSNEAITVLERYLHHRLDLELTRTAALLYIARGEPGDGQRALEKLRPCYVSQRRDVDVLTLLERAFTLAGHPNKALETLMEVARVARDTNRDALFRETARRLMSLAPANQSVRALVTEARIGVLSMRPPALPISVVAPPMPVVAHVAAKPPSLPPPPPMPVVAHVAAKPPSLPPPYRAHTIPPPSFAEGIHGGEVPLTSAMWTCPPPPPVSGSMVVPSSANLAARTSPSSDVFVSAAAEVNVVPVAKEPHSVRHLRLSDVPTQMVRPVRMLARKGA